MRFSYFMFEELREIGEKSFSGDIEIFANQLLKKKELL